MRFENLKQPLASPIVFARRMAFSLSLAMVLIAGSLAGGMIGYHLTERLSWIDAFANAAMILSGMGPLAPLDNDSGKLFAGLYALYSGLFLILVAGLILAPALHRLLHRLRIDDQDEADKTPPPEAREE